MIEEVSPPSEMRMVVIPSECQEEQPTAQPIVLPLVPINQERTLVERPPSTLERFEPKRTIAMVTEDEATIAVFEPKIAPITTLITNPILATAS